MATDTKDEQGLSEEEAKQANLMGEAISGTSTSGEQSEDVEQHESKEQGSETPSPEKGSEAESPDSTEEMPEGYENLSPVEIAKMHQELSKKIGTQGEELGQYRRLIDAQIQGQQEKQSEQPDVSDQMYSDPGAFTERIKKEAAEEVLGVIPKMLDARDAMSKLDSDFPDRAALVTSPGFLAWRDANVPTAIQQAGVNDPGVAHYVLSQYRAVTGNSEAQAKADANKATRTRTAAGAASVPANAQAGEKGVFYEDEIQDMIKNKKDEYKARQGEIILAYQEGRVRKR